MSSSVSARDAEAMLGKFHVFGNLPCELRMTIWKFAARSVRHGIQIFEAKSIDQADPALVKPKIQDNSGSTRDWVDGSNPSTYMQDFGLWTACYESLAAMRRQYQLLEDPSTEEEDEAQPNGRADTLFSGRSDFVDFREDLLFKFFPAQDLLCLQPLETSLLFDGFPFFELPDSLHPGSLYKFKNIALEYDPAWMNGPVRARTDGARRVAREEMWREDSLRGVFIRALWETAEHFGPANLTLWLVDRTIQGLKKPSNVYMPFADDDDDMDTKAEPMVFHGNHGRYVEVKDMSECKYDIPKSNTAFHFIHWLQIDVGFNVSWMIDRRPNRNVVPIPNGLDDLIKVLHVEPN